MSPNTAPARMHTTPVSAARMLLTGVIVASITTTITTGTIGSGRVFVRS